MNLFRANNVEQNKNIAALIGASLGRLCGNIFALNDYLKNNLLAYF